MRNTILSYIKLPLSITILSVMSFTNAGPEIAVLNPGDPMPAITLSATDVSGAKIKVDQVKDNNGTLVLFTSAGCPHTVNSAARIKELTQLASTNKIGVVLINSNEQFRDRNDSYNNMKTQKQQEQFNGYYIMDENSQLANAFGATRTPEVFLFDKNNKLVYKGATDDSPANLQKVTKNYLKDALNALINNNEVQIKEVKAIGCEVKRKY